MQFEPYLTVAIRTLVGMVLLTAAFAKLRRFDGFRDQLATYGVPKELVRLLATVVLLLEIVLGAGLLIGALWRMALLGALFLLTAFSVITARRRPEAGTCGCGGIADVIGGGRAAVVRNITLASMAGVAATFDATILAVDLETPSLRHSLDGGIEIGATVSYLVASLAMSAVVARSIRDLREARRRIDVVRLQDAGGTQGG